MLAKLIVPCLDVKDGRVVIFDDRAYRVAEAEAFAAAGVAVCRAEEAAA